MRDIFVEEAPDSRTWHSPVKSHDVKSEPSTFALITQGYEDWQHSRSLAGSPFDSSDSDSSSDDDAMSVVSSDLSTMRESSFSEYVSLVSESIKTLNALGLIFMSEQEVLATAEVATSIPQAESLQAPRNHQDETSCGRPDQKHRAQFPQDFGLWAAVSDDSGPKELQGLYGSPFKEDHPYGDAFDHTHDYKIPGAPRMRTISLPEAGQDDREYLLYGGPELGGWLTGTMDGISKVMSPELTCIDIGLPMPFAIEA